MNLLPCSRYFCVLNEMKSFNDRTFSAPYVCTPFLLLLKAGLYFFQFAEYGNDGAIVLLQTCLDMLKLYRYDMAETQSKREILCAVFRHLLDNPNFSTVFSQAVRDEWVDDGFLSNLSKALNLSTPEKIAIGLALSDSENLDFRTRGKSKILFLYIVQFFFLI